MRILLVEDEEYMAQAVRRFQKKTTTLSIWHTTENTAWTARFPVSMTSSFWIQILKKSSDCWHKTQQADSGSCPPVCLTIHKVQKMYLWELSEGGGFFSLPAGKKGD